MFDISDINTHLWQTKSLLSEKEANSGNTAGEVCLILVILMGVLLTRITLIPSSSRFWHDSEV